MSINLTLVLLENLEKSSSFPEYISTKMMADRRLTGQKAQRNWNRLSRDPTCCTKQLVSMPLLNSRNWETHCTVVLLLGC